MGNSVTGNTVGVVCARAGSRRLKDKNIRMIGSETLAARASRILRQAGIEDIYCSTDIPEEQIKLPKYVMAVSRKNDTEEKWLQSTVKDLVEDHNLRDKYEYIAVLMPNCPFVSSPIVRDAADMLSGDRMIIRTYSYEGKENGLIYSDMTYYMDHESDIYTGSIHTFGFEIHDIADYAKAVKLLVS